jgi:RNA polymerase sigma-70 factor, ECF subfamily
MPSPRRGGSEDRDVGRDDLKDASDAALVVAIGRWRHDALAEAFRRHSGAVFALARRVLNDAARAEEVVQEVFLRLWNAPDRFDPGRGSLRSYLLAHAHGRAVDAVRSDSSRRRREDRDALRDSVADYDLERQVGDVIVAEHVREAVATLAPGEREAIELAYFGGHTYREVALILDEPEGTIKSRIRSGMIRLRHGLIDAEYVPS